VDNSPFQNQPSQRANELFLPAAKKNVFVNVAERKRDGCDVFPKPNGEDFKN
jgi:hypothetical protein